MIRIITKIDGYDENIHIFRDVAPDGSYTWGARIGYVGEGGREITDMPNVGRMLQEARLGSTYGVSREDVDKARARLRDAENWKSFQIAHRYALALEGKQAQVQIVVTHFAPTYTSLGTVVTPEMFIAQLAAHGDYFAPRLSTGWVTKGEGASRRTTHRMRTEVARGRKTRKLYTLRELESLIETMAA